MDLMLEKDQFIAILIAIRVSDGDRHSCPIFSSHRPDQVWDLLSSDGNLRCLVLIGVHDGQK
ncbi:MAG TPA: hypothetical protein DDY39_03435, partial [Nitrospira sp.]|nr:hypothetical protein [Nitrospira sp.]